jgi:hypothetical protein
MGGRQAVSGRALGTTLVVTLVACSASATGKIAIKAPTVGGAATLKLKLSKGSLKKAKAAMKNGARLKAKIAVEVADAASNASAGKLSVKFH